MVRASFVYMYLWNNAIYREMIIIVSDKNFR